MLKLNIRHSFVFAIALTILGSGVVWFPDFATATTKDPLTNQLLKQAQSKIDVEYKVLISGDATELTKPNPEIGGKAAERKSDIANVQLRRHKMLADHGQKYTKSTAKLSIEKAEIGNDSATITAKEDAILTLVDKNTPDPVITKESKSHTFHFIREGNKWKLIDDSVIDGFVPVIPEVGAERVTTQPISLDTSANKDAPTPQGLKQKSGGEEPIALAATSGSFNRSAAVNYARSYWDNYNTFYRTYGNDCTNFTSQALNWAGWQHIGGWYDDPNHWWYSTSPVVSWGGRAEARSWINVHYFYFFARYSNRATDPEYLAQFDLGDNFHFDFATPDGILDHNAIVTKNNGGGNIFLTYHSVDTLDISIWDVAARTPGANYYGSLMKTSY